MDTIGPTMRRNTNEDFGKCVFYEATCCKCGRQWAYSYIAGKPLQVDTSAMLCCECQPPRPDAWSPRHLAATPASLAGDEQVDGDEQDSHER